MRRFDWIVFDADDTLWDCQGHFERVMRQLYDMLDRWSTKEMSKRELYATERKNMPMLGYGTKAFTLSVMETALRVSEYQLPARELAWLQERCYGLLNLPATPLPEVEPTLRTLQEEGWHMAVFTKGELLDQENKLRRSGLGQYFEHVEITSDKGQDEFRALCRKLDVEPSRMLMVGNSLKSDIAPALAIGAWGIYIPFHITWELEHAEHFDHERMHTINHFAQLLNYL